MYFSRFDGDNNEGLFFIQRSTWWGPWNKSALVAFLKPSISRYKQYASSIDLIDPITIILNRGCSLEHVIFTDFLEVISAYYRYIWGCQLHIPFPNYRIPQSDEDWVSHYRSFIQSEGKVLSENHVFFPNIIHLIVIQNLPYAYELQKYLLLFFSRFYSEKIQQIYDREIPFLPEKKLKSLEKHEYKFEELYRDQIINLINKNEKDDVSNFNA